MLTLGVHLSGRKHDRHQGLASVHTCPLTGTDRFHKSHNEAGQKVSVISCIHGSNTFFSASLVSPEGLVVMVIVVVVSAATPEQGDTGVAIQEEAWVTFTGLHKPQCRTLN